MEHSSSILLAIYLYFYFWGAQPASNNPDLSTYLPVRDGDSTALSLRTNLSTGDWHMAHSKHSLCFPAANKGFDLSPHRSSSYCREYILQLYEVHASIPITGC